MADGYVYVFWCDGTGCEEVIPTRTQDEVSAYITLYQHGWEATERRASLGYIRRHYCPEHLGGDKL